MTFLEGNWKVLTKNIAESAVAGSHLAPTALGGAYLRGSYGGGAGIGSQAYGGLVVASINAFNSVMSITAAEILSMYYGSISGGLVTVGFKIVPLGILEQAPGSIAYKVYPTGSIEGSRVAFVPMALTINAAATASTLTVSYARGASISANFAFIGLIASSP